LGAELSRSPNTRMGAILALVGSKRAVTIEPDIPALIFQYNPETLTHTFSLPDNFQLSQNQPREPSKPGLEQIGLTLEFDATDQLENAEQSRAFVDNGLCPPIAVLELMIKAQAKSGTQTPLIFFLFGKNRTVPVWLNNIKIVEEAFDPNLNPIRARIEIIMTVRMSSEFRKGSLGYTICRGQLDLRKRLAKIYAKKTRIGEYLQQVEQSIR
jgi:hypothetical protein